MGAFQFDDTIELTLESTRARYAKTKSGTDFAAIVNSIALPNTDTKIWSNLFLVKQVYNVMWHVVILLVATRNRTTIRETLIDFRNKALESKGATKKWWEEHSIPKIMQLVDNLEDTEWLTIKKLLVKEIYLPVRPEAFNEYFFASGNAESKMIDVVISHSLKMDFGSVQQILSDDSESELIVAEWLDVINSYEENKVDSENWTENLMSLTYPFHVTPMVEDFLRFNFSDNTTNEDEVRDTRATKIVEKTVDVEEQGPKKAAFNKELANEQAIVVNQLEEIKILSKILNSPGSNIVSAYFTKLRDYVHSAYFNFKDVPENCVRVQAQHQTVSRSNKETANTRSVLPGAQVDVCGLVFSCGSLSYKFPLEEVDLPTLKKYIQTSSLPTDKAVYLPFSTKLQDYIGADVVATSYEETIEAICRQIYDTFDEVKYEVVSKWIEAQDTSDISSLKALSTLTPVSEELFDEMLGKSAGKVKDYLDEYFPPNRTEEVKPPKKAKPDKWKTVTIPDKIEVESTKRKLDDKFLDYRCQHWLSWAEIVNWKKAYMADSMVSKENKEELLSYQIWQKKILEFTMTFAEMTEAGFFICKSCGSILNQRKYLASGSYQDGSFVTSYWPMVESINELQVAKNIPEILRFLDKRFEELCYLIQVYNFVGADNSIRSRKIKEILTWLTVFSASMSKKRFVDFKESVLPQSKLERFSLEDELLKSPETSYFTISTVLVVSLCLLIVDMNLDQVQRLPQVEPLGTAHFRNIKDALFKDVEFRVGDTLQTAGDNQPFAYLLYYISGMLVNTKLWKNQDFYFNFIYKRRGRKSKKPVAPPTIDFKLHREALELLVDIWNIMQMPKEWLELSTKDEMVGFFQNIAIRAKHTYREMNAIDSSFFDTKTDDGEVLDKDIKPQQFRIPFPAYILPPMEKKHVNFAPLFKTGTFPKYGLDYTVKLKFPTIECDTSLNPEWKPCKVKHRLLTKFTMWKKQQDSSKVKDSKALLFPKYTEPDKTPIPEVDTNAAAFLNNTKTTYIIDHNHLGEPLSKPVEITEDRVHKVHHRDFGDVIYYTNSKLQMQIFYDPISLQLQGYQRKQKVEPVIKHAVLQYRLSAMDMISTIGIPFPYLSWVIPIDCEPDVIERVARERSLNMERILRKIRTFCYSVFVFQRPLQQERLEKIRREISGSAKAEDIEIPASVFLSRDYSWTHKFKGGKSLGHVMNHCLQAQEAKRLVYATLGNIYRRFSSTSSLKKVKSVFDEILTMACAMEDTEDNFFDIVPLSFDTTEVQINMINSGTKNDDGEDVEDVNYDELQEQQANDDQEEELDMLAEELRDNLDERENLDAL